MRLPSLVLCTAWVAGCAGQRALPVASASAVAVPAKPDDGVEIRHVYRFTPGKTPVRIVDRAGPATGSVEVSSAPPSFR